MKVILLGGNGFVGSAYARLLQQTGNEVVVVGRANYGDYSGGSCDVLINANGNSKKFLAKENPKEDFQASAASVRNSLVDFKYGKYIYLSSGDVYPDCTSPELTREDVPIDVTRQSPYGFHKYIAEQCVQHAAPDWLIVRQGGFVGPGMRKNAVYDILFGDKLWVHPDSAFQFIGTDNSARLVMELAASGVRNEIINLTARGTISAREIMRLAGRQIPAEEKAVPLRYEMATAKAEKSLLLPATGDSVRSFLRSLKTEV